MASLRGSLACQSSAKRASHQRMQTGQMQSKMFGPSPCMPLVQQPDCEVHAVAEQTTHSSIFNLRQELAMSPRLKKGRSGLSLRMHARWRAVRGVQLLLVCLLGVAEPGTRRGIRRSFRLARSTYRAVRWLHSMLRPQNTAASPPLQCCRRCAY